jgi:hypothetical protein
MNPSLVPLIRDVYVRFSKVYFSFCFNLHEYAISCHSYDNGDDHYHHHQSDLLMIVSIFIFQKTRERKAKLRKDWYQTPKEVIVSIYAKKSIPEKCRIEFHTTNIQLHLFYGEGMETSLELIPFQPILSEKSKFEFFPTKIELTLVKANGYCWPSLEPTDKIREFTTFGCSGKGTIGAKQAYIAHDQAALIAESSNSTNVTTE